MDRQCAGTGDRDGRPDLRRDSDVVAVDRVADQTEIAGGRGDRQDVAVRPLVRTDHEVAVLDGVVGP